MCIWYACSLRYRLPSKKILKWNGDTEVYIFDHVAGTKTNGDKLDFTGEVALGEDIYFDYVNTYPYLMLRQMLLRLLRDDAEGRRFWHAPIKAEGKRKTKSLNPGPRLVVIHRRASM